MNILHIDCSPRRESHSRQLSAAIVERLFTILPGAMEANLPIWRRIRSPRRTYEVKGAACLRRVGDQWLSGSAPAGRYSEIP